MPFTVRIRNFQSIEDATIVVDGLTVITGPNNSGKTAAMRAIKGVFTNPPAGPLVRNGCGYLTVSITFEDGSTIVWEKGWEKPDQKGKAINQYTINGKRIETVGRGVPPEVEDFGVREVQSASEKIWPQIADQFDGTLFLINRPGSFTAEALSDVERVGKLSSALKASEKDRRSAQSELKIRRKDLDQYKASLSKFDGLEFVSNRIRSLPTLQTALDESSARIDTVRSLKSKYDSHSSRVKSLSGFNPDVIPSLDRAEKLQKAVSKVGELHRRLQSSKTTVSSLSGFDVVKFPSEVPAVTTKEEISTVSSLLEKLSKCLNDSSKYGSFVPTTFPDSSRISSMGEEVREVAGILVRYKKALSDVRALGVISSSNSISLSEAESEVSNLLGDRGICPTCNTLHNGVHQ